MQFVEVNIYPEVLLSAGRYLISLNNSFINVQYYQAVLA